MPEIKRSAIVPYSPQQMFDLVNDVEAYPEFLPWCKEAVIKDRDEDAINASLVLAWGGIQKSFTTCNRTQQDKMIEVRLVEGPFDHLEGFWRFEPLGGDGCKVVLNMEFEFAGKLLSMIVGPVFHQITSNLVGAFCKRADEVYGGKKS